jgi:ribonuclease G
MEIKTTETIPNKEGGGSMEVQATILLIDEIEQKLHEAIAAGHKVHEVKAHPFVEAYFRANRKKFQWAWFLRYKRWIKVLPRTSYALMNYKLVSAKNPDIKL